MRIQEIFAITLVLVSFIGIVSANIIVPAQELGLKKVPKWDKNFSDWKYRVGVKMTNNESTASGINVKVTINFTEELEQIGVDTSDTPFDPNSIRISEHSFPGGVLNSNISFEVTDV